MMPNTAASAEKSRRGFTLPELVIACFLASVGFAAVVALQSFVLRGHVRQWQKEKVFNQTIYALNNMRRDVMGATCLQSPAQGEGNAKTMIGYVNVSPLDKMSKIVDSEPQSWFLYCVTADGKRLYRYTGNYTAPFTHGIFACGDGDPSTGGWGMVIDSSGVGDYLEWSFSRPAGMSNIVSATYRIKSGGEEMAGTTTAQLQKSL